MIAKIIPARRMPVSLPFLDYLVPDEMKDLIKVGQLVKIPFLKSEVFGVVAGMGEKNDTQRKLKPVKEILFSESILSKAQINFLSDIAEFYHTSLGFILKTNLPPLQKRKLKKMAEAGEVKLKKSFGAAEFSKPTFFAFKNEEEKIKYISDKLTGSAQILYLVPELPNLAKIKKQLPADILDQVEFITGELSNKDLFAKWMRIWNGEKKDYYRHQTGVIFTLV